MLLDLLSKLCLGYLGITPQLLEPLSMAGLKGGQILIFAEQLNVLRLPSSNQVRCRVDGFFVNVSETNAVLGSAFSRGSRPAQGE